jgi:hypothetical protein
VLESFRRVSLQACGSDRRHRAARRARAEIARRPIEEAIGDGSIIAPDRLVQRETGCGGQDEQQQTEQ